VRIEALPLGEITADRRVQPRAVTDHTVVAEYAELMASGEWDWDSPGAALTVFDDGERYWLTDGYHRYYAARGAELDGVPAEIHEGSLRDAIWHSLSANARRGLRRTADDVRMILAKVYEDPEWRGVPDARVAAHTGISRQTVQWHRDRYFAGVGKIERGAPETDSAGAGPEPKRGRGRPRGSGGGSERRAEQPGPFKPPESFEHVRLSAGVNAILNTIEGLPDPRTTAAGVDIAVAYAIDPERVKAAAVWLAEFARAWADRWPEAQAYLRRVERNLDGNGGNGDVSSAAE
jgi:hypothetical protein